MLLGFVVALSLKDDLTLFSIILGLMELFAFLVFLEKLVLWKKLYKLIVQKIHIEFVVKIIRMGQYIINSSSCFRIG